MPVPTYQYRCTACEADLEVVQKFTDDALTTCPECEGTLRKVYNAVGVVFKGSGFYKTDSRSTSKPSAAPSKDSTPTKETPAKESSSTAPAAASAPTSSAPTTSTSSGSTGTN